MTEASAANNIITAFLDAAARDPDAVALVQDGKAIRYGELRAQVVETAAQLQSRGIAQGDRVLLFVPMSLTLYRVVLALFYLGASPVFLDEWVSIARLKACLEVAPCKALIAKRGFLLLSFFVASTRRIPIRIAVGKCAPATSSGSERAAARRVLTCAAVRAKDTALVTFTTGSTGTPKAADRTHAYLYAQLAALSPLLSGVASPCLTLLPIVVLLHLGRGKAAVLPPKGFKAAKPGTFGFLLRAIEHSSSRALIASPAVVGSLIANSGVANFSEIQSVVTGGGPVYPHLARRMAAAFPNAAITAVYGSTEAEPIAHTDATEIAGATLEVALAKGLPVGPPDGAAEVAVIDMDAASRDLQGADSLTRWLLPAGAPGEIMVAGPHVLRHYINNPEAERETKLHVGGKLWHRTGDCGVLDADGRLYLRGRCKEVVHWNGQRHDPTIVAYALREMVGVGELFLIDAEGTPALILEAGDRAKAAGIGTALDVLGLAGVVVRYVNKIPKDPRHQTKVDVERLRRIVGE